MNEKDLAEQTVRNYFKHLYDANIDAISDLYIENGVLMPADLPTATGKEALIPAYKQTFSVIKFVSATTEYDEISVYGDIAIVRPMVWIGFIILCSMVITTMRLSSASVPNYGHSSG